MFPKIVTVISRLITSSDYTQKYVYRENIEDYKEKGQDMSLRHGVKSSAGKSSQTCKVNQTNRQIQPVNTFFFQFIIHEFRRFIFNGKFLTPAGIKKHCFFASCLHLTQHVCSGVCLECTYRSQNA